MRIPARGYVICSLPERRATCESTLVFATFSNLNSMEGNMRLRKVCPQCNTILHARRSVCGCGHAFPSKRKAQCIADKEKLQVIEP